MSADDVSSSVSFSQFPSVVVPVLDSIDSLSVEVQHLLKSMREEPSNSSLFKDLEVSFWVHRMQKVKCGGFCCFLFLLLLLLFFLVSFHRNSDLWCVHASSFFLTLYFHYFLLLYWFPITTLNIMLNTFFSSTFHFHNLNAIVSLFISSLFLISVHLVFHTEQWLVVKEALLCGGGVIGVLILWQIIVTCSFPNFHWTVVNWPSFNGVGRCYGMRGLQGRVVVVLWDSPWAWEKLHSGCLGIASLDDLRGQCSCEKSPH